jgi:hypothetical protein
MLMPAILSNGFFHRRVMLPEEAVAIARSLLVRAGAPPSDVDDTGTHGAKATLLSWCAKWGVPKAERRLLGGHLKSKDQSVEAYSRDEYAKPLRSLYVVIQDVKDGRFNPDATRSGLFKTPASLAASSSDFAPPAEVLDSDDDPDLSPATDEGGILAADAADANLLVLDVEADEEDVFPDDWPVIGGLYQHATRFTLHVGGAAAGKPPHLLACSRKIEGAYVSLAAWPLQRWDRCTVCSRALWDAKQRSVLP